MPRLDPAPRHLAIDSTNRPQPATPNPGRGCLLSLSEEGRRRASEAKPAIRGELGERMRVRTVRRERLFRVHVAAGVERAAGDPPKGGGERGDGDDVDFVVFPGRGEGGG